MIKACEVLGSVEDFVGKEVVEVKLEWYEVGKRIIKKELDNGDVIGIKFDKSVVLKPADVVAVYGDCVYVIEVLATRAFVIDVDDVDMVAKVCYELGNRHLPLFRGVGPMQFFTPIEEPVRVLLRKLGVRVSEDVVLLVDRICSDACHSHELAL
ncbi:MAG: hypothetical protein BEN18_10700 [Epulopiscium sp. Nuni2H_MBin001]|nr:MAG: hypothetical protein BEN18_10700 [Epulopiscium sp. Nuni2H_MBin001]